MDIQKTFFSFKGRLNRKPYFLYNLGIGMMSGLIQFIVESSNSSLIAILGFVAVLILTGCSISVMVKRLHDLDKSGYFGFIMLIPLVNIFFGLYLLFFKGTTGYNRFGEDPLQ